MNPSLQTQGQSQSPAPRRQISLPLGQLVSTPGALAALAATGQTPMEFLLRHASGDWGVGGPDDWASNDEGVKDAGRVLSAYHLADGTKLWIITEADRSATTCLLPEEY